MRIILVLVSLLLACTSTPVPPPAVRPIVAPVPDLLDGGGIQPRSCNAPCSSNVECSSDATRRCRFCNSGQCSPLAFDPTPPAPGGN